MSIESKKYIVDNALEYKLAEFDEGGYLGIDEKILEDALDGFYVSELLKRIPNDNWIEEESKDYDKSAHSGHFAGEEPGYHFESGANRVIYKISKIISRK